MAKPSTSLTQLISSYRVGWAPVKRHLTMDGQEVTHFGLDAFLTRYYRTANATYAKHGGYWVRITP